MMAIDLGVVFGRIGAIYDAQSLINWFLCTYFEKNSIFEKQPFWPNWPIWPKMPIFGHFWGGGPTKIGFFSGKIDDGHRLRGRFGRIGAICDAQSLINWFICTDFEKN